MISICIRCLANDLPRKFLRDRTAIVRIQQFFQIFDLLFQFPSDIVLTEEMLAKGNRLMDMNLPKGMLVMLIKRGNEFMIPNGSLQLHAGDKLLIISESKTK